MSKATNMLEYEMHQLVLIANELVESNNHIVCLSKKLNNYEYASQKKSLEQSIDKCKSIFAEKIARLNRRIDNVDKTFKLENLNAMYDLEVCKIYAMQNNIAKLKLTNENLTAEYTNLLVLNQNLKMNIDSFKNKIIFFVIVFFAIIYYFLF